MPYEYSIDTARNLIRERYWGTVTLEDLRGCAAAEWADPAYRRHMNLISDFRGAVYTVTAEEMRDFGIFLSGGGPLGRTAVLVSSTLGRGLTRMFELTTEQDGQVWSALRVFTDPEEAERWATGRGW